MRTFVVLVLVAACGHRGMDAVAPDGAGAAGGDARCGTTLAVHAAAPDIMFALDRSCSMTQTIGGGTTTKWQAAIAAMRQALVAHASVRWGLTMFPDISGLACAQEDIQVPIAEATASTIEALLSAALIATDPLYPDGPCVTNIDTGIATAATDPGLTATDHAGYVVLVTDGKQANCSMGGGNAGTEATIQTLHDQRGVTTFVVGFGAGVDATELDKLAHLGGAPLPGPHAYYQADTPAAITAALASITSTAAACTYHVDPAPADLGQTYVWLDHTQLVPHDPSHASGWDFDPTTSNLTFYGPACVELASGATSTIDIIFGCDAPPV